MIFLVVFYSFPVGRLSLGRLMVVYDQPVRIMFLMHLYIFTSALHKKRAFCSPLNPIWNKCRFLRVCSTNLLKTLWEKDKLLVAINFSFSRGVFYPFVELSAIVIKLKMSATSFSLEESSICRFGKG